MHGQGNYNTQVGQGPYPSPPAFQQHPATTTHPPASHPGPRPPQQQFIQPQFRPGILPHQHGIPNVASQGPPSTGMSSAQSYLSHPQPPQVHVSNQMSHSYQTSEQQRSQWSQNVHHLPPPPPRGPSAYSTPSQAPSHALPPPPPPYSSTSSFSISETFGSSALSIRQHSNLQSMGPLPPPPPRPPPAPRASPPRVPPLPPSSPFSDIPVKNDGNDGLKGSLDGGNLMLERPIPVKNAEDRHVHQIEVPSKHTEDCGPKVESVDAAAHSPADSDMDMEDDITHPDEEKMNCLSNNYNDEPISISQENYEKEQKPLQHTGGQRLPKVAQDGNSLLAEVSVTKDQIGGSGVMTDSDFPTKRKVSSEADNLDMIGQTDSSVNTSSQQHKEGADTFKLLQGYASNTNSENEGEDLLRDLSPPPTNDKSPPSDAKKILSSSITEAPKKVTEADESSFATEKLNNISHKSHSCQESKSSLRNSDAYIGPEGANIHKADTNSNSTKLNVDEFGRLIREGVSDSDTSDSSHHARRPARRSRKRSRSHSRSRSPHDRRRRRSPRRRNERRGRSRSFSPKRCRSRSRSPVLRRDSEFSGDKSRRAKSQLPECFDFLRGKCYRGAACRYSHHESDKSERSRYNRGRQQYPDLHESKALPVNEVKDNFPRDMPVLKDVKDAKELLDHSAYSAHDMPSGKPNSMVSESPAQYSEKIPQIVDQARSDSVISESISLLQASAATSTNLPADKDAKQDPFDPKSGPTSQPDAKQLNLNSSSASQVMNSAFSQPIMQDYNYMPYQAPVAFQHPHFPALLNSLSTTFLPPPPPPPPRRSHLAVNVTAGEHILPSQNVQQSSVPPQDSLSSYTSMRNQPTELPNQFQSQYQRFPLAHEPGQMQHTTYNSGSGGPHIMGEDCLNGNPRQAMSALQPFPQAQPNSLLMQPSRMTPDFSERNRPSYVGDFQGSRIPNHFNPYASTFDLPLSSKFSSNALIQENDSTVNTKYSAPVDLSSVNVNANKIEINGSKNMMPSTESVLPRSGGDQYDPLFDSLEPASTSFSRADHLKYDNTGDSDNMMRFSGLNMEGIDQNGATAVSANDFVEKEECGETADAEVGAVLNLSPSDPNDDATDDMNEGEIEIDQVKASGEKKKGKDSRSTRLFKISIATFVKEVLKPSWRQGNMSKEAFKTIVKKTVDKVSGAMKSHKMPKSQGKINHYIDSSRGKLTKLVMGYVDKYVKA